MAKNVLTYNLSEPLDGAATVKVEIDPVDGNLIIDGNAERGHELVSGELQYLEKQGIPTVFVKTINEQTVLSMKAQGGGQMWLRLPWRACNGATEWQIHLNPDLPSDIIAHSGGGNVKLDLSGMKITGVSAETGGGNMDVILPESVANTSVTARSGAGNVTLIVPNGISARIHATTGMGKVIMDPQFSQIDKVTFQSPDYERASEKVEITLESGAGNVSVATK